MIKDDSWLMIFAKRCRIFDRSLPLYMYFSFRRNFFTKYYKDYTTFTTFLQQALQQCKHKYLCCYKHSVYFCIFEFLRATYSIVFCTFLLNSVSHKCVKIRSPMITSILRISMHVHIFEIIYNIIHIIYIYIYNQKTIMQRKEFYQIILYTQRDTLYAREIFSL